MPAIYSPEEQALKDAADEQEQLRLERSRLAQERFLAWRDSLTPAERKKALQGHPGGPTDPWLRKKWEEAENGAPR